MIWFPYESYYILSPLPPGQVSSRLAEYVSPTFSENFTDWLINRYSGYYKGFVNATQFKLEPVVVGRNSFVPQIKGTIEQTESGSRIRVIFKLSELVQVLIFIAFTLLGAFGLVILMKGAESGRFDPNAFIPFAMMILIYMVMMFCFVPESISSKKFLLDVFEAEYE